MCSDDKIKIALEHEITDHIAAKRVPNTAVILCPAVYILGQKLNMKSTMLLH